MKKIILIILCLFMVACKEKIYEDPDQNYIDIINSNVLVYSDVHLNDLIEKKDNNEFVKIVSDNYRIDTTKVGKKEYKLYYVVKDKKYVFKYNINVIDNEPPLVFSGTNKTVNINYEEDLCNLITYGDNYSREISCVIKGDYDLNTAGTYKLQYSLKDSSQNEKIVNVTLNVKDPEKSKNKETPKTPTEPPKKTEFSEVYELNKNDNTEIGIDVSKWQGEIDFTKVKEAGASFVMMRIGVQSEAKGDLKLDTYYKENIKKAKDAGLKVGVYLYSIATSNEEAIKHANWTIKALDGEKLDLPIVFDWENWTKWNSYKISFYDINSIANSFLTTIKNKGYDSMLYSSKFYLETIWTNKLNFPVWLAHYTTKTNYEGKYKIWQLCNDGHIDGIKGDVDIDIMYK